MCQQIFWTAHDGKVSGRTPPSSIVGAVDIKCRLTYDREGYRDILCQCP
jgi:hypothetical protein